ncbi:MAG: short-chain dehydrogenase/reductase [Microbacteriaceae bacterium]|nr:short-chain dehydrogenase/reductase [Microbacteriaceae bacterium]
MSISPTDFSGGVAVITGAGSGIGAGLARSAATRGMSVVLADVDERSITELSKELDASGIKSIAVVTDVSDFAQVDALAGRAFSTFGDVDLLVNNAGVESHGLTWEMTPEGWGRMVGVNLNGIFNGIRAFVPRMLEAVDARTGRAHIVDVASVAALGTRAYTSAYGATKHANLALSESVALELAGITDRIVVSVVMPAAVRTRIFSDAQATDSDGPGFQDQQAMASLLAESGIDPNAAAEIIFRGAAEGRLHIHTDPAFSRGRIDDRYSLLVQQVDAQAQPAAN